MLRTILTIGVIQALAVLINVFRSKVLAVLLGPEGVGTASVIDQIVQFTGYIGAISLPFASLKFLSRAHSESSDSFIRTYGAFFGALLVLSAGATVTLVAIGLFDPASLGKGMDKLGEVVGIAALSIPAMTLMGFFTNVLAAARRTRSAATVAVAANGAATAGACAGLAFGSIRAMYIGTAVANVLLIAALLLYLRAKLGLPVYQRQLRFLREFRAVRGLAAFSLFTYLSTSAYAFFLLMARTAVLRTAGPSSAGLLQAGLGVSMALGLIITPANGLLLTPLMNRNAPLQEKMSVARVFQVRILLLLGVGGMAMVLFPQLLLRILFSPSFDPAAQFLFLFVISQCVLQVAGVHQALMIGLDDLRMYGLLSCAVYLAAGALCCALAPFLGIAGVGYSLLAGMAALWFVTFYRLNRRFGFTIPVPTLLLTGYTVIAITSAGAFARNLDEWSLSATFLKLCIYFCYSATLLAWLDKGERKRLLSVCRFSPSAALESA
jgi:antigen flippase